MTRSRILMLVLIAAVCLASIGVGAGEDVTITYEGHFGGGTDVVVVSGNHAYISQGYDFVVLDISDPKAPFELGRLIIGNIRSVAILDNYAYVANYYGGLVIIDISDPAAPTLTGSYDEGGRVEDVAVSGSYAYITDYFNGLVIIDISDPTAPTFAGSCDTGGVTKGITVSGSYAYVVSDKSLVIIDINDPTTPTQTGSYYTGGIVYDIAVSGSYAYVVSDKRLVIINIGNPYRPFRVSSYYNEGYALDIAILGSYVYVTDDYNLSIINIGNPWIPTPAGSYDTAGDASDVTVSGSYAYVADHYNGLVIIDISDPSAPTPAGSYDTVVYARDIAVSGSYAYVADINGLATIDISNPAAPTPAGRYYKAGSVYGVAVSGSYAYVADFNNGIVIIDISNPAAPTPAGSFDTVGPEFDVAVSGSYAYVAGWYGLVILDISNPSAPTPLGSYDTAEPARGIAVSGSYAYVANGYNGLVIFDISDPTAPTLAGSYDTTGYAYGVAVSGSYAYVADKYNLVILDISNPTAPILAGSYAAVGNAWGVAVSGSYVYVADYRNDLVILSTNIPQQASMQDKSLLQVEGQPEVYWFQNNKLYCVTDLSLINIMEDVPGWDFVNILSASEFNPVDYPQGPMFITKGTESDGLLIQDIWDDEVYLIFGGEKHHFISSDALLENGYSFEDVIDVNQIISLWFPSGSDIGTGLFSVQITSPNNGDMFSQSEEITYRAEVSGGIPGFEYKWIIDGNSNVHIEQINERISEWSFPISLMDIGDHTVKLEVIDSLGNVAESESINYFTSDYDLKVKSIYIYQPVLIVDGEISIDIVVENVGQQEINSVNHDLYIRMIAGNKFGNYNILQEEKFSGQLDIQAGNTQTISKTFIMSNDENHELMFMVDAVEVEIILNEYQESNILNNRLIKDNILTFISMDDQTNCIFSAVIELISVNGVSLSDMYTFLESDPELKDSMGSLQFAAINEPIDALDMYAKFIIRLINLISIENSPEFVYNFVKNTIVGLFELGKCGGYSMIQMTNIVYQIQDGITTNINDYIFRVESPVDIEIINANSQSAGYVNGNIVTDIGDSYVLVDGSTKTVVIFDDADTNYMIKLTGTGDGTFNFYISSPKDDILREYKNIPVNVNSIGVLETENYILNMDFDGDGNIDQTILPTYISVSGEKLYNITFLPPITTMDQFNLTDGSTLPIKFTVRNSTTDEFIYDDTVNVTITNSTGHLITYFTYGTGTDSVRINSEEEQYIANFHTKDYAINIGEIYSVTVTFGEPDSLRGYDITYFTLIEGGKAKGKGN